MKGATLFKYKYLIRDNETGWVCLGKPIILTFDNKLIEKLYGIYSDNEEIGGLLLCKPKYRQKEKELVVIDIIPIRNLSRDPRIYEIDKYEAQEIIQY